MKILNKMLDLEFLALQGTQIAATERCSFFDNELFWSVVHLEIWSNSLKNAFDGVHF